MSSSPTEAGWRHAAWSARLNSSVGANTERTIKYTHTDTQTHMHVPCRRRGQRPGARCRPCPRQTSRGPPTARRGPGPPGTGSVSSGLRSCPSGALPDCCHCRRCRRCSWWPSLCFTRRKRRRAGNEEGAALTPDFRTGSMYSLALYVLTNTTTASNPMYQHVRDAWYHATTIIYIYIGKEQKRN